MPNPHGVPPGQVKKAADLVVAYLDANGNDTYDKADTLIAAIKDTNKDQVLSVGDTVVFGEYPLDANGTQTGNFTQSTATIATLTTVVPGFIAQGTTSEGDFSFSWSGFEIGFVVGNLVDSGLRITDSVNDGVYEIARFTIGDNYATAPGHPDTAVNFHDHPTANSLNDLSSFNVDFFF